jgi:thymidylate synthase (FAD)
MPHLINLEAEEQLDVEHKVLDKGFVRLVDYMGGDQRIVDAARVSYQAGTKKASSDRDLIRYLLRHKHTTPFEKVRFEFHIKIPIFVMRQWIRHRMSSTNEESARYSVMKDEFYIPEQFRGQAANNKQGSSDLLFDRIERPYDGYVSETVSVTDYLTDLCANAYEQYQDLLGQGVTREMARMVLPVNLYTEFYWTVDLWNLMSFLKLRLDSHAQLEIQECAKPVEMLARAVCPDAMEAWTDYINDAKSFSRMEVGIIRSIVARQRVARLGDNEPATSYEGIRSDVEFLAKCSGINTRDSKGEYTREFKECLDKLGIVYGLQQQEPLPLGNRK